jgi:hypothetical protein
MFHSQYGRRKEGERINQVRRELAGSGSDLVGDSNSCWLREPDTKEGAALLAISLLFSVQNISTSSQFDPLPDCFYCSSCHFDI